MKNIIKETEIITHEYLQGFGFSEDQISSLVIQGKKDLHKELTKLETMLVDTDTVTLDELNNVLHALKGLLFQMGNHDLAKKFNEIRSNDEQKVVLRELSELLFDEK